ncbi:MULTISPECIES: hypothetical protein [Actinosynnema]|uniref:Uncharacterized protein n=1 Tax=Actinosynnema pretiosum TaxID=42197 RepID=A0A290YYW9_9PSEU|nr:hypothetical protein [Actinosynnema pretiosum]ATE51957.1 hypothetical protein CNX65_00530 [Actinosynnema pretiosum]
MSTYIKVEDGATIECATAAGEVELTVDRTVDLVLTEEAARRTVATLTEALAALEARGAAAI